MATEKRRSKGRDIFDFKVTEVAGNKRLYSLKRKGVQVFKLRAGSILPRISIDCPERIKKLLRGTLLLVVVGGVDWLVRLFAQ